MRAMCRTAGRGFSLLEMTISLGLAGTLMMSLWQMMGIVGQLNEAGLIASQAQSVAYAAQAHLALYRSQILPLLPNTGDVLRLRITDGDTGNVLIASLQGAGHLPQGFLNRNSYGQSYALFVQRQDGGAPGVDEDDRLIGLLITTGGAAITDRLGDRIIPRIGAAGGFVYTEDNPAPAATAIRGTAGGWQINFSSGSWASAIGGGTAQAGRLAILTALLPPGGYGAGSRGSVRLDDLTDVSANHTGTHNFYLGEEVGGTGSGQNNTGLGALALQSLGAGNSNTAYGVQTLRYTTSGSHNVALGALALYANQTGSNNTAIGSGALYENAVGSNNTAIGLNAGPAAGQTALSNTISVGANARVSASNTLNIGNILYGNLSTSSLSIGGSPTSGISLDAGSKTDSIRPALGTTAQRPACDAAHTGAMRWNISLNAVEFCDGASWVTPLMTTADGTPPTPPAGSGFIVLTNTSYTGNLGGLIGADAKCLLELTTNITWKGYVGALAGLKLLPGNVHAWLPGRNFIPLGTYAFARIGSLTAGGGTFTVDVGAGGPNNSISWAAANYFAGTFQYWTGLGSEGTAQSWGSHSAGNTCNNWTSSSGGVLGGSGSSSNTGNGRWYQADMACNTPLPLICYVDP